MSWYADFYRVVDTMNVDLLRPLCTPDTTVRFANHQPVEGWPAVSETLERSWSSFAGMHHRILGVVEAGDHTVIEAIVDYTRHDGAVVSVPAATALDRRAGLVAAQRIYIDLTPLYADVQG